MKVSAFILIVFLALCVSAVPAQTGPTIPSWIHSGLTVMYNGDSAFVQNGRHVQPVQLILTTRVNSVSSTAVSALTQIQTVGTPLVNRVTWTCNAAGNSQSSAAGFSGQFWVDPNAPTASTHGANGEPYSITGQGPYNIAGKTWAATTMTYQNQASGVRLTTIFETKSGLVLAHAENFPTQQAHVFLRGIQ
jgi:hypothetical protein